MAARQITITQTLEEFRQQFNALSAQDFGDITNLDASISATSIVGAVNELVQIVGANEGFYIEDSSSSQQLIGAGQRFKIFGAANECTATVTAEDTLTIGLAPNIIVDSVTAGSIKIENNTISAIDSSLMVVDDAMRVNNELHAGVTTINPTGSSNITSTTGFTVFGSSIVLDVAQSMFFEGATGDSFETELTVVDPTASRTITLPNETGTVALTGSTGWATSTIFTASSTLNIYDSSGSIVKTIVGSTT